MAYGVRRRRRSMFVLRIFNLRLYVLPSNVYGYVLTRSRLLNLTSQPKLPYKAYLGPNVQTGSRGAADSFKRICCLATSRGTRAEGFLGEYGNTRYYVSNKQETQRLVD